MFSKNLSGVKISGKLHYVNFIRRFVTFKIIQQMVVVAASVRRGMPFCEMIGACNLIAPRRNDRVKPHFVRRRYPRNAPGFN